MNFVAAIVSYIVVYLMALKNTTIDQHTSRFVHFYIIKAIKGAKVTERTEDLFLRK